MAGQRDRLRRTLPAGVVDGVVSIVLPVQDQLRDRHEGVAVLNQRFHNCGQSFRRVERGVVEKHNGPGLYFAGYPLDNLVCGDLLPVQTVHVPYDFKCNFLNPSVRDSSIALLDFISYGYG